ncbi:MAG: glycosyltransferase family 4 protein [Desulfobacterales bacterium]|nr:glycosyltransferase family 4 protein [Desulfobacterales bacterium]
MHIYFYTPFKPLGHLTPSGDLMIAKGLFNYLVCKGHQVHPVNSLRTRWIYWKPWLWPKFMLEQQRILRKIIRNRPDLWLTYHSYYKAPDILGPIISKQVKIPYVIFQGIYSTKRKRNLKTLPGFILNKQALKSAQHVFTNRCEDLINLNRILPKKHLTYISPGIKPKEFCFDTKARSELRYSWNIKNEPVILSAAMFRPGVKSVGIAWLIRTCRKIFQENKRLCLVIAGNGEEKNRLIRLAEDQLPGQFRFVGQIPQDKMYRFYSAGDIFAFPGIKESLGMVFLEAQSCGLPVVAFANGGIPEVVKDRETGFLLPPYASDMYADAIKKLIKDKKLRAQMGEAGRQYVWRYHDLNVNYEKLELILKKISQLQGTKA